MELDLKTIPANPGVYLFKDEGGRIIYVGKAKHLRRRVSSYFRKPSELTPKTRSLMACACHIDTISTITEKEALLLEASLIKKHRPRYNIVLRDDKQYIFFCLDRNMPYPRLAMTRPRGRRRGRSASSVTDEDAPVSERGRKPDSLAGKRNVLFFGPFISSTAARETWKVIHQLFPLRRCRDRSFRNRVRPCLYYHLGQCCAPCGGEVPPEEYAKMVRQVELFLNGRSREITDELRAQMEDAAERLEFETAARIRDRLAAIEQTIERQAAVLEHAVDMDVLGVAEREEGLGLGVLFVRQGKVLDGRAFFWPGIGLAESPELIASFLAQFYGPGDLVPPRVVIPWKLPAEGGEAEDDPQGALEELLGEARGAPVTLAPPRNAQEERLVSMAAANAREAARTSRNTILDLLAQRLDLPAPPARIECVDVSHTGGRETRVGVVVFEDGRESKKAHRAWAIPDETAHGDDHAALAAWLPRRLESGPPWPDLLLVDGGRGQLATVERALADNDAAGLFALAAIAKARNPEGRADRRAGNVADRIFLPGRANPLPLREGSPELLFLQMIRDAAHEYAIGRHRSARNAAALASELMRLPGVGPKTAKLLWQRFDSLREMTQATEDDLAAIEGIGKAKAKKLRALLATLR